MSDPRVTWGSQFTLVRQDPHRAEKLKMGLSVPQGWMAYLNHGVLFVKTYDFVPGPGYPDGGVNSEVFTNAICLELETLGMVRELAPGAKAVHTERWSAYRVAGTITDESSVWPIIGSSVQKALALARGRVG
jgi:hypothetical protein